MRNIVLLIAATTMLIGCSSVRVAQDYAVGTNFNTYRTYGYYKKGIDEADINELDKKRILRAIDKEMQAAGFTKSEQPDLMVNIFTKSQQRVYVYNNWGWNAGWGWGWGGFGWGGPMGNQVSTRNEGVLHVDLIDTKRKELIWQGIGTAVMQFKDPIKKTERINEMVHKIMRQFPPQQ